MAKVDIPELAPGIHFFPPQNIRFKVVAVLGIVSDLFITDQGYEPQIRVSINRECS